jgi:hypothetical protein
MPPWHGTALPAMVGFWLALGVTGWLLLTLRKRVMLVELTTSLAMTALVFYASRFATFWAIAMIPIWARWIELARPRALFNWELAGSVSVSRGAAITMVCALVAFGAPWARHNGLFDRRLPLTGARELRKILPEGRIYNYREWGGVIAWVGHPRWRIAIDGRLYRYDEDDWRAYHRAAVGNQPLDELVARTVRTRSSSTRAFTGGSWIG